MNVMNHFEVFFVVSIPQKFFTQPSSGKMVAIWGTYWLEWTMKLQQITLTSFWGPILYTFVNKDKSGINLTQSMIWVNCNISLWIKAISGWFPYKNHDSQGSGEQGSVVIIYPEWWTLQHRNVLVSKLPWTDGKSTSFSEYPVTNGQTLKIPRFWMKLPTKTSIFLVGIFQPGYWWKPYQREYLSIEFEDVPMKSTLFQADQLDSWLHLIIFHC